MISPRFVCCILLAACCSRTAGFSPGLPFSISVASFNSKQVCQTSRARCMPVAFPISMQTRPTPPPPPPRRVQLFDDDEEQQRRRRKNKPVAPEPQAGLWRENLGLGLGRLNTKHEANPKPKVRARNKANKNAERPPPPMLTRKEWEAAGWIGGAADIWELGNQFLMAKEGRFEELEFDWVEKGASRKEIMKRLGNARKVQTEAKLQERKAEDPKTFEKSWAAGKKMGRPPSGLFFRYMTKQQQEDGRVLAMSAPRASGVREDQYDEGGRGLRLMSASKGGSDNQRRLKAARSPNRAGASGSPGRGYGGGNLNRLGSSRNQNQSQNRQGR